MTVDHKQPRKGAEACVARLMGKEPHHDCRRAYGDQRRHRNVSEEVNEQNEQRKRRQRRQVIHRKCSPQSSCSSFPTFKFEKNRLTVSDYANDCDNTDYPERVTYFRQHSVLSAIDRQPGRNEAFQVIEEEHERGSTLAGSAQDVGRAGRPTANCEQIDTFGVFDDPVADRQRSEHVGCYQQQNCIHRDAVRRFPLILADGSCLFRKLFILDLVCSVNLQGGIICLPSLHVDEVHNISDIDDAIAFAVPTNGIDDEFCNLLNLRLVRDDFEFHSWFQIVWRKRHIAPRSRNIRDCISGDRRLSQRSC